MATDQFGNILSPEEEERLRQHQLRMKALPGFPGGVAVDTFSGIPTSLPAYGPAAGLGPSSYMGAPQGMPTYNQSPSLAAPSLLVDAGMAPVVELAGPTGDEVAFGAFGAQHVPGTSLPVDPSGTMNFQDFLDKVGPVQSGTRDAYYMPDGTVRNAAGDLVSTETTFDPTAGLAATDLSLQGVTPTSTASVDPTLAGMSTIPFTETELPSDTATQVAANDWAGMGIYDDLLSKKTLYDMGPGHPTVIKELIKTLEDQRNVVVDPGPTAEEVEVIIEKAISAPTGNLERIAIAKAAAKDKRASDLARQKKAAADKRAADRANAQRQKADAAARAKQKSTAAKALQALMATKEKGTPSSAEINAMIEVMTEVDTFGSGGMRGNEGGRSSGAAIDSSDRGTGPF